LKENVKCGVTSDSRLRERAIDAYDLIPQYYLEVLEILIAISLPFEKFVEPVMDILQVTCFVDLELKSGPCDRISTRVLSLRDVECQKQLIRVVVLSHRDHCLIFGSGIGLFVLRADTRLAGDLKRGVCTE
jgi:hypothetical protein